MSNLFFKNLKSNNLIKIDHYYIQFFIVTVLTLICSYPLLEAYFYIIDDHQIITNLANLKLEDTLNKRFTPSWYFLKTFELYVFDDNPHFYYLLRILGLILFNLTIFYFISLYSKLVALVFIIYQLLQGYWFEIFARLGPAEFYSAIACSLFFIFTFKIYKNKESSFNIICSGLIGLIAFTIKENFVFIPFIFFYVIIFSWKKFNYINRILISFIIALSLFLLLKYFIVIFSLEIDIYSNEIDLWQRLFFILSDNFLNFLFLFIPHLFLLTLYTYQSKNNNTLNVHCVMFGVFVFLICVFQYYFYNGKLYSRYLFPYQIIYETSLIILLLMYFFELDTTKKKIINFYDNNKILLFFSVVIVAIPLILNGNFKKNIDNYKLQTSTFKNNLDNIKNLTIKNPNLDLVFLAGSPGSIEPVNSVKMFLAYMSIENKIFLKYIGPNPKKFNKKSLEYKLSKSLIAMSSGKNEKKGWSQGTFSKNCLFVHFDSIDKVKSFDANRCHSGPVMRPL